MTPMSRRPVFRIVLGVILTAWAAVIILYAVYADREFSPWLDVAAGLLLVVALIMFFDKFRGMLLNWLRLNKHKDIDPL